MNNLAERLNTWTDHCDRFGMGAIVLRLDIFSRILVNLDIDQEMEDTVGNLHLIAVAMERSQYSSITSKGYRPPVNFTGGLGRPSFEISKEHLAFLLEQGFEVQEISSIFGVGKITVERRMTVFGFNVAGKLNLMLIY